MRLLVTGAAGDFGRDLVPLLAQSHEVRATDLVEGTPPCEFLQADLQDEEALEELVTGRDGVIHLAALLPTREPRTREWFDVNTTATALLMGAAASAGVGRFIYVSTVWATGHGSEESVRPIDEDAPWKPICPYGLTKLMGELVGDYFARTTEMQVTVLRMCGYLRCPQIAPDGYVDWARPEWPELVLYLTRPGQKIFDPLDLLDIFEAALRLNGDSFSRYVVGQQWPFQAEDAKLAATEPEKAWAKYYPVAGDLFRSLGINPPELPVFYSPCRFSQATGWRQRITLDQVARRFLAAQGDRV